MSAAATTRQITCLQILWNKYAVRHDRSDDPRAARLAFAGGVVGRQIASFRDLSLDEAGKVIDALNEQLGNVPPSSARMGRESAQSAGTEGRRDADQKSVSVASRSDIERIQRAVHRLGWSEDRFQGWLRSPRSPLRGRTQIRTLADANRVWWALKSLLKKTGKWVDGDGVAH